jgi:hypothetical protein
MKSYILVIKVLSKVAVSVLETRLRPSHLFWIAQKNLTSYKMPISILQWPYQIYNVTQLGLSACSLEYALC